MSFLLRTATRLFGSAAVSAGIGGLLLRRWAKNPSPHGKEAPEFPAGHRRSVVTDDGAYLSVAVAGEGPPIVLVHGITSNANDWGFIAKDLISFGFTVYAIDQRGHGASTVGSDGFGAARLGRDIATVLDKLDITGCVLAGHSMGGIASMSFATDHPEVVAKRVVGLGLVSTIHRADSPIQRAGIVAFRVDWSIIDTAPALARFVAGVSVFGTPKSLTMIDHALASARKMDPENRTAAGASLTSYNVKNRLPQISVPTRVVCGKRDLVTPIRYSRFIAKAIPNSTLHEYKRAGHQITWERRREVAEHIAALSQR